MKLSRIIGRLQDEMNRHGDLECYTEHADIHRIVVFPCKDGVMRTTNGKPEKPNELVLEFRPAP